MPAKEQQNIRDAAVAGLFYPKEPDRLAAQIDYCLQNAHVEALGDLKAVICPHAGYQYSGVTAAHAYRLIQGRNIRTVILLAPSHYAMFRGAYVTEADVYRTPLGSVKISKKAATLAEIPPFSRTTCRLCLLQWVLR